MDLAAGLKFILPEIFLLTAAFAVLFLGLFKENNKLLGGLSFAAVLFAAWLLPGSYGAASGLFFHVLLGDAFSEFFKFISLFAAGAAILISIGYDRLSGEDAGEYYFLIFILTIAMMLIVSAADLLMIYIAFEMLSIASYLLVGFLKRDALSGEAALKYFLFGVLATGVMLYGLSLIYGLFGSTDLSTILTAVNMGGVNSFAALVALLLIFGGLAFKCALFPFQMWVPDAYQGAPTPVTALISVGPKAAGFAVLLRLFFKSFSPLLPHWIDLAVLVSVLTMTIGNVIALAQTDIKRMLAYSSIAHAGYILIGFVSGNALGLQSVLFYVLAYALMNLGAFGCVALLRKDNIEDYAGLYKKEPASAFMLTIFLLSLAGIPPLAGFLAKFLVFAAAIKAEFVWLAIIGALNSVVALFYYVKVIKYMYLDEPESFEVVPKSWALQAVLVLLLVGTLVVGLWPSTFINWSAAGF